MIFGYWTLQVSTRQADSSKRQDVLKPEQLTELLRFRLGLHKSCSLDGRARNHPEVDRIMVLSEIIFYLLQDGCRSKV